MVLAKRCSIVAASRWWPLEPGPLRALQALSLDGGKGVGRLILDLGSVVWSLGQDALAWLVATKLIDKNTKRKKTLWPLSN